MFKLLFHSVVLPLAICHGFVAQPRIINGVKSVAEKYSYFVRLDVDAVDPANVQIERECGATLLTDR